MIDELTSKGEGRREKGEGRREKGEDSPSSLSTAPPLSVRLSIDAGRQLPCLTTWVG